MQDITNEFAEKDLSNSVILRQLNSKIRNSIDPVDIRNISVGLHPYFTL